MLVNNDDDLLSIRYVPNTGCVIYLTFITTQVIGVVIPCLREKKLRLTEMTKIGTESTKGAVINSTTLQFRFGIKGCCLVMMGC